MFAPQNQQPDIIDAWYGNLKDWYESIDMALKVSEIIPGNYQYTTATSYNNVGEIGDKNCTMVDISCDRFKIVSLENSYITLEQNVTINVPSQKNMLFTEYYIGYKTSADVFNHYRFYSNTDKLQDINNANYEWFMLYNSLSDEAKRGNDCYATLEKIREHNPMVPGAYVDLSKITEGGKTVTIKIPLRIPITMFLLFNLRYFPEWAGRLSLEIFPTYENLVIAPVVDEEKMKKYEEKWGTNYGCDFGFRNIGETVSNNLKKADEGDDYSSIAQRFEGVEQLIKTVKIKLATYLLKMDVANALALKYTEVGLLFPIHEVAIRQFTSDLGVNNSISAAPYNEAATIALHHCDTVFIVFRQSVYSRTCFINPQITYSLNIDGQYYPIEPYSTIDDVRHINMLLDALNVNNSLLTSISKDILTSVQPYYHKYVSDADGKTVDKHYWHGADNSNFFIGIPFADSEDFMGGLTSSGAIQVELTGTRLPNTAVSAIAFKAPVGIYYEDCFLKIRAVKPVGRPQIQITHASIEQILTNQANAR